MSNFRLSADLMSYIGAQYISVKARPQKDGESNEEYAKVPLVSGVFIPDKYNGIEVKVQDGNYKNKSGLSARLNLNLYKVWAGNDRNGQPNVDAKLLESFKKRLADNGVSATQYDLPSHRVYASMKKDFIDGLKSKFAEKIIKEHPELNGQTIETSDELRKMVYAEIPNDLGLAFEIEPKPAATPTASPVTTYQQPVVAAPQTVATGEAEAEELPF